MKSERIGCSRYEAYLGETRSSCKFSVGNPEGKEPLGRILY
jgi:hypothetical protein